MSIYRNVSVIQGKDEIRLGRYSFIDGGGQDFLGYGSLVTGCFGYEGSQVSCRANWQRTDAMRV
jgi:hypothetical protein